jgi:hypothetical protein
MNVSGKGEFRYGEVYLLVDGNNYILYNIGIDGIDRFNYM